MNEVVGSADYLRFVLALILVVGLIGLAAMLFRKYGLRLAHPHMGNSQRRLNIQEILPIDARHRVVLVRQDGREHLILIGPNNSLVIESGMEIDPSILAEMQAGHKNGFAEGAAIGEKFRSILRTNKDKTGE